MKTLLRSFISILMFASIFSATAMAGETISGVLIDKIMVRPSGQVLVKLKDTNGNSVNFPADASCNDPSWAYSPISSSGEKALLSTLLTAATAKKEVTISVPTCAYHPVIGELIIHF